MTSPQEDTERSHFPSLLEDADGGGREYGSTNADGIPDGSGSEQWTSPAKAEPFPFGPVAILAICMSLNGYALSNLFPYVGMMVKGLLGLETTNEVGYMSGYVASSFTFGRFLSGYVWGSFSDRFGRKPVIIIGLLSIATFSLIFGCSTSYKMALISRLILGLMNGIMPALRTTVSEVCGPEHCVVGMTYVSSTRAFSIIIGTGLGGVLSQPALHFPGIFAADGVFGRYPYLLPNFVGAVAAVVSLLLVVFYLPETRDFEERRRNNGSIFSPAESPAGSPQKISTRSGSGSGNSSVTASPDTTADDSERSGYQQLLDGVGIYGGREEEGGEEGGEDCGAAVEPLSRYQQLGHEFAAHAEKSADSGRSRSRSRSRSAGAGSVGATDELSATSDEGAGRERREPGLFGPDGLLAMPYVSMVLALAVLVSSIVIGFDEVYPLFALSTPEVGGLGWNTMQIGQVMVVTGLLMAGCQLFLFPPFIKMVGLATWQRLGCGVGVVTFMAVPAVTTFSWDYPSLFTASVVVNAVANCCCGAIQLALTIGSTNLVASNMRGKLGGLYNTAESLGRFTGPVGYSTAYAWSISPSAMEAYGGWVNFRFVFYVTAAVLVLVGALGWRALTIENMMKPEVVGGGTGDAAEGNFNAGANAGVGGGGGGDDDESGPRKVITLSSSSSPPVPVLGVKRARRGRAGDGEGRGGLARSVDLVV